MYQRSDSGVTDASRVSASVDELTLHLSTLGVDRDDVGSNNEWERGPRVPVNDRGGLMEPPGAGRHVMRVTVNATNVTIYNGAASALPIAPHPDVHVRRGMPHAAAHARVRPASTPGIHSNSPRNTPLALGEGMAVAVELPGRAHPAEEAATIASDRDAAQGHESIDSPGAVGQELPQDGDHAGPATVDVAPPAYPGNRLPWNPRRQYFADPDPYHRGKWYVVTAGIRVGIWKAWVDMAHHVTRVRGNAHQAFDTREEAMHWYSAKMREGRVVLLAP
ncbi:hypothetical protein C8Q76DRAFT_802912 [Earliella scabrosa]|nr:hypothetical protein C8Q76DRAFT_802912 [Earliella scabrosa]